MSEIDWDYWLNIVLDYGKRFPENTLDCLGLDLVNYAKDVKFGELVNDGDHWLCKFDDQKCIFCTYNNIFKYRVPYDLKPVPNHIKLRLLVEGKEDLV